MLRKLRVDVNKAIEGCRTQQKIGSGLEAGVMFIPQNQEVRDSLEWLIQKGNKEVDIFRDWLIVSEFEIVDNFCDGTICCIIIC